jgi:hypothetical protein
VWSRKWARFYQHLPLREKRYSNCSTVPTSHQLKNSGTQLITLQVTTVCLENLGLRKLAHLDLLPNLRWLSLANNALTSLEVGECSFFASALMSNVGVFLGAFSMHKSGGTHSG